MKPQNMITDKQQFQKTASQFLNTLFAESLKKNCGEISIEVPNERKSMDQTYHNNVPSAVNAAYKLCQQGLDVYVGVNPRVGSRSQKSNIHWIAAFHAEIDYGTAGHNKESKYDNYEDALAGIMAYEFKPTLINHSGGGFHCYWVLNDPAKVSEISIKAIESVNKALTVKLKGDVGTQNINRVLRVPGTFNFKILQDPRPVTVITDSGPTYDLDVFRPFMNFQLEPKVKQTPVSAIPVTDHKRWDNKISSLPVSEKIQFLIVNGNDGSYSSRSEADQAVITALVNKGMGFGDIKTIFTNYKIGDKYREHSSPDNYLRHNIKQAEKFSNLTEEERQDPLFISGALHKDDKDKYHLKIVPFQEFMNKKHMLKFLEKERAFFRYNGQCYEQCSEDRLNNICQTELEKHRELFTPASKANFIHFAIGNDLVDMDKAFEDQIRYLTLQNGLYDLFEYELISHNSGIFTTNLLPYDYNPEAECPRWLLYLDEVFLSDTATILFVQEAVGYAFHKSIPKAVLFFLIGDGGNGKSVFIDIISSLCGKDNVCNISLNRLNDEKYLPELFGKMINVSGETPSAKQMNTDLIKSVVSGDWVTGRAVYQKPSKFKPYAKHYLGMNTLPEIDDNTHGMWRRIHVIEFPRKFAESEMDVELTGKLMDELSGIFNWALEGYKRLRDQEFIFSKSPSMQKSKREYRQKNSSVIDFAESHLDKIIDSEKSIPLKDAYIKYQRYCLSEGIKIVSSKIDFSSTLQSEGYWVNNSKKHANQVRIFASELEVLN